MRAFSKITTSLITGLCLAFVIALPSCNNAENVKQPLNTVDTVVTKMTVVEPTEAVGGKINGRINGCGYDASATENDLVKLYYPRPREIDQINAILKYSGLASNFKIYSADIANAIATIIDNKRYILYDPKLLSYTDRSSGSYWSSMSILAHEIGHHLSGHTLSGQGSNPNDELEADKFSGFILYKLGASLPEALAAMETLGSPTESATHPAKSRRLQAIKKGWNEANEQRYDAAIPPPPDDDNMPSFEGEINELGPQNLFDARTYNELFVDGRMGTGLVDGLEGIIIERPRYYYGDYTVLITKNKTGDIDGNIAEGQKAVISLFDTWDAVDFVGRVNLPQVDGMLIPGRKIRFSVAIEGTAPSVFFTRIKPIPRSR